MEGCWPKPPSQRHNEVAIKLYHTQSCHHPKNLSSLLQPSSWSTQLAGTLQEGYGSLSLVELSCKIT